jgi:hypothetical protein
VKIKPTGGVKKPAFLAVLSVLFFCLNIQVLPAQVDNNRELPETETRRRKSPNQRLLRLRSKVFTVNILRFNKKIRTKHDREVKALERYELRLKKQMARKDARQQRKSTAAKKPKETRKEE